MNSSTRSHLLLSRALAALLAGLSVALLVAVAVAGVRWMRGGVSARTTGYTVQDATRLTVTFTLNAPAHSTVVCQARAQASDGLDVGLAEMTVMMEGRRRDNVQIQVPTRRAASKGEVTSCRAQR